MFAAGIFDWRYSVLFLRLSSQYLNYFLPRLPKFICALLSAMLRKLPSTICITARIVCTVFHCPIFDKSNYVLFFALITVHGAVSTRINPDEILMTSWLVRTRKPSLEVERPLYHEELDQQPNTAGCYFDKLYSPQIVVTANTTKYTTENELTKKRKKRKNNLSVSNSGLLFSHDCHPNDC